MADTYGVVAADIAAELPGIFPGGFSASTKPTDVQVTSFITTQDTVITLRITDSVLQSPAASDRAAVIAKRFIIEAVKAMVIGVAYAGNDPAQVAAAVKPYGDSAITLGKAIDDMGQQAVGTGEPAAKVLGNMPDRCLVLDDCDLDGAHHRRGRF